MQAEEVSGRLWERMGRGLVWGLLILVLTGVIAAGIWSAIQQAPPRQMGVTGPASRPPVYGTVPDFSLQERSGRPFQLSDLQGHIWIANFMFTSCPDVCPLITAKMAGLQADLQGMPSVRLVSITVDPERDTPAALVRYAERFGADPERWLFLTGEKASIYRLAREGFHLSVIDAHEASSHLSRSPLGPALALAHHAGVRDVTHATRVVLVDGRARIRGYYDANEEEALLRLRQHVLPLLRDE